MTKYISRYVGGIIVGESERAHWVQPGKVAIDAESLHVGIIGDPTNHVNVFAVTYGPEREAEIIGQELSFIKACGFLDGLKAPYKKIFKVWLLG